MKVSELTGDLLDYYVAKAQRWEVNTSDKDYLYIKTEIGAYFAYHPTTNWQQCGELIEKFNPCMNYEDGHWEVSLWDKRGPTWMFYGRDLKTEVCRAVVASVYGDSIEDASGGE